MPKRKISIEDAFAALEAAGIQVQVKKVAEQPQPQQRKLDYTQYPPVPVVAQVFDSHVKITLYAKHMVGSGGCLTTTADGSQQVQEAGVASYGPGVVTVPVELAQHLLHQDSLARQADAAMLDNTAKRYVVAERYSNDGILARVGIPVTETVFDNVNSWPALVIRGNG